MEGELNLPIDLSKQNHPTMEGFSTHPFQDRHIQSSFIWANPYINTISGLPMFQGVPPSVKDLQPDLGLAHLSSLQHFSGQQLCDVSSLQPFCSGFSDPSSSTRTPAINYGLQADQLGENMVSNDWMSQNYMNLCLAEQVSNANNELSLRLSAYGGPSINNQCSDMSGSDQQGSRGNASGKQSMSCGLNRKAPQLSQIVSQPRYLGVVQEILSQFASFSLENMDQQLTTAPYLDHCAEQGDSFKGSDESSNLGGVMEARDSEAKRSQLLALLQMLDDCYNQCLDEVHTVISAFHAATELDPHRHACFALRTISVLYKSLKGRISNQILRMGAYDEMGNGSDGGGASGSCSRDQMERSFEKSFIQKQWALQQLKKKDMQLWRPQRGLPERSVSVLRAWMFQNFLHPYPKDAEKHLLAIKSGLTRSQVSNWFINARVRLWKPLIEEMYAELNRSRAGNSNQGNEESNTYNCLSIHNSRYSTS